MHQTRVPVRIDCVPCDAAHSKFPHDSARSFKLESLLRHEDLQVENFSQYALVACPQVAAVASPPLEGTRSSI